MVGGVAAVGNVRTDQIGRAVVLGLRRGDCLIELISRPGISAIQRGAGRRAFGRIALISRRSVVVLPASYPVDPRAITS